MNPRSIIFIVLIVAALFGSAFIWYRFFSSPAPSAPVTSVSSAVSISGPASGSLLALLESLKGISLDLEILNNPIYRSLRDFTPNILAPELKGRPNPFAPLGR